MVTHFMTIFLSSIVHVHGRFIVYNELLTAYSIVLPTRNVSLSIKLCCGKMFRNREALRMHMIIGLTMLFLLSPIGLLGQIMKVNRKTNFWSVLIQKWHVFCEENIEGLYHRDVH